MCEAVVPATKSPNKKNATSTTQITTSPAKTKRKVFKCLNSECRTTKDLIKTTKFVSSYYGTLEYPK